jgi:hypothetical protein
MDWLITCPRCGFHGLGRRVLPGSDRLERMLWYLLILPGLGYRVWRTLNARAGCSQCGWDGGKAAPPA